MGSDELLDCFWNETVLLQPARSAHVQEGDLAGLVLLQPGLEQILNRWW